jgi:predicted metalloprotease with PDZ domain
MYLLPIAVTIFLSSAQANTIRLDVDATEIARGLIHVREVMPAKPGELTVYFPKFIPGEHGPSGRLTNVVNLHFHGGGKEFSWRRDPVEVFEFHVSVPQGARDVTVTFDAARDRGENSTNLARLNWHEALFYKAGTTTDNQPISATLTPPTGWTVSCALDETSNRDGKIGYETVSVTRLIDSPTLMGRYYQQFDISRNDPVKNTLEVYGEDPAHINFSQADLKGMERLVQEFKAQTGAQHYRRYKFLISFSGAAGAGLEHHECSEDGMPENTLSDENTRMSLWDLLGHEGFHSWNGKFRRPIGLCTPDYTEPMKDELLWVYEGMTQFYGHVLPTRAGLWTQEHYRERTAATAQRLMLTKGRNWRTIEDTTFCALTPSGRGARSGWYYMQRGWDYYDEMTIVWLEADMRIRSLTHGAKSLSDFSRIFHGGLNRGPELKSYDFAEVVRTLNQVAPYDWAKYLKERVYTLQPNLSLAGFEMAGWRYVENDTPNNLVGGWNAGDYGWFAPSIGLNVRAGEITEIVPGSAADKAGLAPGWKISAVNGTKFSIDVLKDAVKATSKGEQLALLVERDRDIRPYTLDYHGGLKYPHLERIEGKPDLLAELLKPLAK